MVDRIETGIPPVTGAEFRELAEWFAANEARLVLTLAACAIFGSDRRAAPAAVFLFLFAVHLASVFEIPAGRFRWAGVGASLVILGLFAWERVERFEALGELQRTLTMADGHDAKLADAKAREQSMSREESESTAVSLRMMRADVEAALQRIRSRFEVLNSWESFLGFASLGGLLLHSVLTAKARRAA
jgi:hypothetical protein